MTRKRFKKNMTEEELTRSDSEDEDFIEEAPQSKRKRPTSSKKKPRGSRANKNKKQSYLSEEDDEISDDLSEDFAQHDDEEETEIGATGRPVRRAAKSQVVNYAESDPNDDEFDEAEEEEVQGEVQEDGPKGKKALAPGGEKTDAKKGSKIVILRFPPAAAAKASREVPPSPVTTRRELPARTTRARSAGYQPRPTTGGKGPAKGPGKAPAKTGGKTTRNTRGRGASETPAVGTGLGTRRSSRLGHDEEETLVALTDSGKHARILNQRGHPSDIKEETEGSASTSKDAGSAIADDPKPADPHEPEPMNSDAEGAPVAPEEENEPEAEVEGNDVEPDVEPEVDVQADDEDEEMPTVRTRRGRAAQRSLTESPTAHPIQATPESAKKAREDAHTSKKRTSNRNNRRVSGSDDDEFQLEGEPSSDDAMSSERGTPSKRQSKEQFAEEDSEENSRTRGRGKQPSASGSRKRGYSTSDEAGTQAELQEELDDLRPSPKRRSVRRRTERLEMPESYRDVDGRLRRRTRNERPDYRVFRPELAQVIDDDGQDGGTSTPSKKRSSKLGKTIFDTYGPFGGGPPNIFGGPPGVPMDIDSDSSDDEIVATSGPGAVGGPVGMTPTTGRAPAWAPPMAQTHNIDPLQGGPANLGKVTKGSKQALADSDPVGVSSDLSFESVGGLDDKIQQLKEMVMLPLMYEDVFKAKNTTPPRGVLFHGPPGTGKTLMARVLAAACSTENRKVTFYMRKGADCLSKWVGEAERQLRLLFEEAKNNQPSIIFFDEIDGLAPVRSSKQDQIHASIVSTLLALMDGMDGRGQVVVIGATNRPDAVDPALRRPGRFDREFYFPLPALDARRKIIDIHTKKWDPPLEDPFKDHLAAITKGYGGADLRALCTEASLIAIQRTYPQIYKSVEKLKVDPSTIKVSARDFMMAIKKMVPSSERSSASAAAPLPPHVKPLLAAKLDAIKAMLSHIFPQRKRLTALEEAEYEDEEDPRNGFRREMMMENFENSRVFRPRLLIHGPEGMGQQYLGPAVLQSLEGIFVQSFDLSTLMSDSTRSPEAAIVQLFVEVKRHKPSVIYIPNIDIWYEHLSKEALASFRGLLRSLAPNDQVLLLATMDSSADSTPEETVRLLLKDFFNYSQKGRFCVERPRNDERHDFFSDVIDTVKKSPLDFPPEPESRQKRVLPELQRASPPPEHVQTKEEKKAQQKKDKQTKNWLKHRLYPSLMMAKEKFGKRARKPVVSMEVVRQILNPPSPQGELVGSDLVPAVPHRYRAVRAKDGELRFEDTQEPGKWYYNMDLETIEDRFLNGYYSTPKQFLADFKRLKHDCFMLGEQPLKTIAHDVHATVEINLMDIEQPFVDLCEGVFQREKVRAEERKAKAQRKAEQRAAAQAADDAASRQGSRRNSRQEPIVISSPPAAQAAHSSNSNGVMPPEEPKHPAPDAHHSHDSHQSNGHTNSQPAPLRISQVTTATAAALAEASLAVEQVAPELADLARELLPKSFDPRPPNAPGYRGPGPQDLASHSNHTPAHTQSVVPSGHASQTPAVGGTVEVTRIAGSTMSVSHVINDASPTTSSGKRTSDATNATTGGYNSQSLSNRYSNSNSNGTNSGRPSGHSETFPPFPNFGMPMQGDSQLPDTQLVPSVSSQGSLPHSHRTSQHNDRQTFVVPQKPANFICDEAAIFQFHRKLVNSTSGYSVEQLEQVNSAMMESVWRHRMSWNRTDVMERAWTMFQEVDDDIRSLQDVVTASSDFDH